MLRTRTLGSVAVAMLLAAACDDVAGNDCDDAGSNCHPDSAEAYDAAGHDADLDRLSHAVARASVARLADYTAGMAGIRGTGSVSSAGTSARASAAGVMAPATLAPHADINECVLGMGDCDRDPAAVCANTVEGFTCACPASFTGTGRDANGCLWNDPSLVSLVPSVGALSPRFAGVATTYTLGLRRNARGVSFSPAVAEPTRATIRVNGAVVESRTATPEVRRSGFAATPVTITVTTESGATRTYTVVIGRGGSTYIKASNTGANDGFGGTVALSADGSTLAVGARGEDPGQMNNGILGAGAVYVFRRVHGFWSQQAYVKPSNTETSDWFGSALALSADGSTLAVGAELESSGATGIGGDQGNNCARNPGALCGTNGEGRAGAAYIFTRARGRWSQQAYVKASNTRWRPVRLRPRALQRRLDARRWRRRRGGLVGGRGLRFHAHARRLVAAGPHRGVQRGPGRRIRLRPRAVRRWLDARRRCRARALRRGRHRRRPS